MSTRRPAARLAPSPVDTVLINGRPTELRWCRHARARRITLRVDPGSGAVVLTLPPRAGRGAGLALLRAHEAWLRERIAALPRRIDFADGAVVPLGGVPHRVRHDPAGRGGAWLDGDGAIVVAGAPEFLPRRLGDFLRAEARRRLGALVRSIADDAALRPGRLTIKDTSSRWGSCTADGTLMFTWRLVMAPAPVQHYVVAHELAHLGRLDHSPAFWTLVERLTPHRRHAETWLRAHGPALLRIGGPTTPGAIARLAER